MGLILFAAGQCFIHNIGSDRRAIWLLIRHLSSSGTFRASYDASIWPPVGIASALRRNSVSASILRLADAQSALISLILANPPDISRFSFANVERVSSRSSDCASGSHIKVRSGFMELSVAQKWMIYLQTILAIYDNRYKNGEKS